MLRTVDLEGETGTMMRIVTAINTPYSSKAVTWAACDKHRLLVHTSETCRGASAIIRRINVN
jgi:hypothetical protein